NGSRNLYQLGPAPRLRLFARDLGGLVFTDDGGCSWRGAGGALDSGVISDALPHPPHAHRRPGVGGPPGGPQGSDRAVESTDGGTTFTGLLYTAGPEDTVSGVEIARADPDVVYLVVLGGSSLVPRLARSMDRGVTWDEQDLSAALGNGSVVLVAVD